MATKTIDHMDFYVAIAGYQLPSVPDQTFNSLRVSVGYRKGSGFYVSFHPGWGDGSMWGCMFDFSKDPLSAGMTVDVVPAEKNNVKRIAEMTESLKMAKDIIAALFDDREWQKLKNVLQNAARFGYTEGFKEQAEKYLAARVSKRYEKAVKPIKPIESETNNKNNNPNSTTMAQNVKAADLIGKVIIVGNNQGTITVKSVQENGMLACEFKKTDSDAITPMTVTLPNLQKMQERGLWRIQSEELRVKSEEFAAATPTSDVTTEADVQEVQDIVPVVTPKKKTTQTTKTTVDKPAAKVEPIGKKSEGRGKKEEKPQPSTISPQTSDSKLTYETYDVTKTNKETGEDYTVQNVKIVGFELTDTAYLAGASFCGGMMPETIGGKKVGTLRFSHKWAQAAKAICDKLNAGGTVEDCVAIMEQAKADRKQRREDRKAKIEERKAKREERKAQPSKDYSKEDVAEMLRKVLAGGDVPEDIKALMKQAA